MTKVLFFLVLIMMVGKEISGQVKVSASASTTASIITPVGTQNSGNIISATFLPEQSAGIIVMKNNTGVSFKKEVDVQSNKFEASALHITGGQFSYAVTVSFDPIVTNLAVAQETLYMESLFLLPAPENNMGSSGSYHFNIGAKFTVNPLQAQGRYSSPNPLAITINFN